MVKPYNLMFGCFGNGITICCRNREEYGDYAKIAHIAEYPSVVITWYKKELPDDVVTEIKNRADKEFKNSLIADEKRNYDHCYDVK